ncbi:hypothetical protein H6F74_17970 [Trichocoleus sp. FACHB-90]|uniref:hypothetical protein n=1 Tax=Cyanophyceae TaxID=3028117 RepID=UPI00168A1AB7|nr:hypothetical protein [Trichocoleus sp. FACHB-90]MBD1928118.1 hypothetical protein [Trichocoleus sp. FACHB-90]
MKKFSVDFYLWYEDACTWLLIPPVPGKLKWSIKLPQSELISCDAGIDFRIDDVLFLGNERDRIPLDVAVFELANTLLDEKNSLSAKIRASEFLSIEIKRNPNAELLISRLCTSESEEYLEKVAKFVGSYYEDFPVDYKLWSEAVKSSLDGLALVFGQSKADLEPKSSPLADWLITRFRELTSKYKN